MYGLENTGRIEKGPIYGEELKTFLLDEIESDVGAFGFGFEHFESGANELEGFRGFGGD